MFTTIAFSESQDPAASYTSVNAVPDQHVTVNGDVIYVPNTFTNVIGVAAFMGATVPGNPYLDSPSLRRVCNLDISPVVAGIIPTGDAGIMYRIENPLMLESGEGLKLMDNSNPAAAEYHTGIVLLADGSIKAVTGSIFTLRATASITGVNGNWANGALTFSQVLPVGYYQVVGASVIAANAVGFRFVPVGSVHRPGGICIDSINDDTVFEQRMGRMGTWFEFHSNTPPTLDILAVDACTAQTVYLDLIRKS